jgi:hypothetical protein
MAATSYCASRLTPSDSSRSAQWWGWVGIRPASSAHWRGLPPLPAELGIHVCGGRGNHSRQTPYELVAVGDRIGLDSAELAKASRLFAKVDSAAVQDGFNLYLHAFIVTDDGQGRGPAGHKRRSPPGLALSLALRRSVELCRRTARCNRDGIEQGLIVNLFPMPLKVHDRVEDRGAEAMWSLRRSARSARAWQRLQWLPAPASGVIGLDTISSDNVQLRELAVRCSGLPTRIDLAAASLSAKDGPIPIETRVTPSLRASMR